MLSFSDVASALREILTHDFIGQPFIERGRRTLGLVRGEFCGVGASQQPVVPQRRNRPASARRILCERYSPTASATRAIWWWRRTGSCMSTPGPAVTTATPRPMKADFWLLCRILRATERPMSSNASARPCKAAAPAEPASACTRALYTPKSTIKSCATHCSPARTFPATAHRPSCRDCLLAGIIPCTPLQSMPTDSCISTSHPQPTPASPRTAKQDRWAPTLARSLRPAAAYGATTRIKPARRFHRLSVSRQGSATARDSRSIPPGIACLSLNTAAISCTRIGRLSISPTKRLRCRPKNC